MEVLLRECAIRPPPVKELLMPRPELSSLLDHSEALLNVQQYLVRSGTPVCHYLSPPSQIVREARSRQGSPGRVQTYGAGKSVLATPDTLGGR